MAKQEVVEIPAIETKTVLIRLKGISPLVVHKWSEKAKKQIRDKQQQKANKAREKRDPDAEYHESLYRTSAGGYGFPCVGFKAAAVSACRNVEGITMTLARGAFHVIGDMATIDGTPHKVEHMVRVGRGAADFRYRGMFDEWSTTLPVRFNPGVISLEQLINLFNIAGFAVGVGEGRPESSNGGMGWGMFEVERSEQA